MTDEIIGKRFGRLIVEKRTDDYITPSGGAHKKYMCLCDCGAYVEVIKEHLTSGRQRSCGCLRRENGIATHGETHTRLYKIWGNMCNRCSNPNNPAWERYGGRGIFVCNEWRNFECFRDWANANGYKDNLTIDRIDNNMGYNPQNCRWVNAFVQANNKRNNHLIEYDGQTMTLGEWAKNLHIPYKTLHRRVTFLGWEIERAFNQPLRSRSVCHNVPNNKDG